MAACKESGRKWDNSFLYSCISCRWSSGAGMLLFSFWQPPACVCFDCCWYHMLHACQPSPSWAPFSVSFLLLLCYTGDLAGWSLNLHPKFLSAVQTYCLYLCWIWFCFFSSFNMWNNSKIHLIVPGRQRSLVLLWHWVEGEDPFAACFPLGLVTWVPWAEAANIAEVHVALTALQCEHKKEELPIEPHLIWLRWEPVFPGGGRNKLPASWSTFAEELWPSRALVTKLSL